MLIRFKKCKKLSNDNNSRKSVGFSIVNTKASGKRIRVSPSLINKLGSPTHIEVYENERGNGIILIPSNDGMLLKENGIIYNSQIVDDLTDLFQLDFSNKTSLSFHSISVKEENGEKYAEVIIHSLFEENEEVIDEQP